MWQACPVTTQTQARDPGLSAAEVADRIAQGQLNHLPPRSGRTVADIVRANVFTRINAILAVLLFVGLNTRDAGKAQAEAFVRNYAVPYPNLLDPDGRLLLRFGNQLSPNSIPSTVVVDTQGRIAARVLGEATEATLVALIEEVAAGN